MLKWMLLRERDQSWRMIRESNIIVSTIYVHLSHLICFRSASSYVAGIWDWNKRVVPSEIIEEMRQMEGKSLQEWEKRGVEVGDHEAWAVWTQHMADIEAWQAEGVRLGRIGCNTGEYMG
jgi:hypothetical protein